MELGIKGNETRGAEVIKILEMLGGKNRHKMSGSIYDNYFYYIDDEYKDISYSYIGPDEIKGYKIFSLEDFLEKYPYKVGDKVKVLITENCLKVDCSGGRSHIEVAEIKSMRWNSARCEIAYRMKDQPGEFYKSEIKGKVIDIAIKTSKNMEEKKINQMSLANCDLDEVEIVLGDRFELKIEDGKYYAVRKKPTYPTTYAECCKVIGYGGIIGFAGLDDDEENLYGKFISLKRCRDAYWKIAGEQMKLGKPWEPDWSDNDQPKFGIHNVQNNICTINLRVLKNLILVFPTIEMREYFHKNFKNLIETCKELL